MIESPHALYQTLCMRLFRCERICSDPILVPYNFMCIMRSTLSERSVLYCSSHPTRPFLLHDRDDPLECCLRPPESVGYCAVVVLSWIHSMHMYDRSGHILTEENSTENKLLFFSCFVKFWNSLRIYERTIYMSWFAFRKSHSFCNLCNTFQKILGISLRDIKNYCCPSFRSVRTDMECRHRNALVHSPFRGSAVLLSPN